ncbi:ADP-ribosylglycohydrolase family protein [Candidatus Saccharibacteria bacterium]|nr:ADP-ribosylglycohydrolase family protein [Calditrichia bacterium]NIV71828.1 ADP-ribosylglycohydrolase family protein [Calditrichia bacterium]NIV98563.1 ADP-ribosylglycohydrolase family protein [Candidatus Saccharibacteria bacterium]NIW79738.1 ADP-ribosylglycohydrolase family protein [Calditrichia bacterium]
MLGAIAGDIIGSIYEGNNIKTTDFPLFSKACTFTDDTVLSVAIADCILNGGSYRDKLKEYYRYYPYAGFGGHFQIWAASDELEPYYSFGNGAAMRVSPVGFAFDGLERVLEEAKKSAGVTHNHPEGIKGAQATASAVFLAKIGQSKADIRTYIEDTFVYNLDDTVENLQKSYTFEISCQGTVPQSIIVFLASSDFEDAIRKAISIGGDSDTIACIVGGIAHAHYKNIPKFIQSRVYEILDAHLRRITTEFVDKYCQF